MLTHSHLVLKEPNDKHLADGSHRPGIAVIVGHLCWLVMSFAVVISSHAADCIPLVVNGWLVGP